jgi:hypothetical protein
MKGRIQATGHDAITQLDDFRHPYDALGMVSFIGQQHQEVENGRDQNLRVPDLPFFNEFKLLYHKTNENLYK